MSLIYSDLSDVQKILTTVSELVRMFLTAQFPSMAQIMGHCQLLRVMGGAGTPSGALQVQTV